MKRTALVMGVALALLLTGIAPSALAESATVNADTRVYQHPSEDSESIRVSEGTAVTIVEYGSGSYSGWVRIQNPQNGMIAYIQAGDLSSGKDKARDGGETVALIASAEKATVNADTRVYQHPSEDSESMRISAGAAVAVVEYGSGPYSGWARIQNPQNGMIAYIQAESLSSGDAETRDGGESFTAYVVIDSLPLYASASTASDIKRSLRHGRSVTVLETRAGWAKVSYGSTTGFAQIEGMSKTPPADPIDAYVLEEAYVYESDSSQSGRYATAPAGAEVTVYAIHGDWCKVAHNGTVGYMKKAQLTPDKDAVHAGGSVALADWFASDIQSAFSTGSQAVITDVDSGISWRVKRRGGSNHADVEPLTAADTAAMWKACADSDGDWTYIRHAVWVTIDGQRYAASIYSEPHGESAIDGNGYPGHLCVHFLNSRTHGTDRVDEDHQKMILKAYQAG